MSWLTKLKEEWNRIRVITAGRKIKFSVLAVICLFIVCFCGSTFVQEVTVKKEDPQYNNGFVVEKNSNSQDLSDFSYTPSTEVMSDVQSYYPPEQYLDSMSVLTYTYLANSAAFMMETAPIKEVKPGKKVPILYYHAINDNINGLDELFVSPAEFDKQMLYLKQNGYNVITFSQLADVDNIVNPVIITFDDGYEDNYTYAYPILKKYNFKATVFLCTDVIDKPLFLKKNQIEEMKNLIDFQSHTVTHRKLSELKKEEIEFELTESKKQLEALTGNAVSVLAYPIGDYNSEVIEITRKYYKYAVLSGGGIYRKGDNSYEIKRVYIPRDLDVKGFEDKIRN